MNGTMREKHDVEFIRFIISVDNHYLEIKKKRSIELSDLMSANSSGFQSIYSYKKLHESMEIDLKSMTNLLTDDGRMMDIVYYDMNNKRIIFLSFNDVKNS